MNLFWVALTASIILFIALIFLSRKYHDELEKLTISRINQSIDTKISIDDIEVSFIRTFPYLSLVFNDVVVWSSHSYNRNEFDAAKINTDTLFTAQNVYLQFNPIDLLRSEIRIRRVYAVKGKLNMLVDSEGGINYRILKKEKAADKPDNQKERVFALETFRLSDFTLLLNNLSKKTYSYSHLDNMMLKGKFAKNEFSLGTNTSMTLYNFTRNGFRYANNYNISLKLIMDVQDSIANIRRGEVNLNTIRLDTRGRVIFGKNSALDLDMESRNINIATLLASFPGEWREKIPFKAQGRGDLAVRVNGPITATRVPSINSIYVLHLEQMNFGKENLKNIRVKGSYTNGKLQRPSTTEINIERYRIQDRNSDFEGSFKLANLVRPTMSLELGGKIDAAKISDWVFRDKEIEVKGIFMPAFILRTQASSFKEFNLKNLSSAGLSGELGLLDVSFRTNRIKEIRDINGRVSFAGDSWYPEISVKYEDISLELKAQLDHVLKYMTGDRQILWVNAIAKSEYLDLGKLLIKKNDKSGDKELRKKISFPEKIAGKLYFNFDEINTGRFTASNVGGNLTYQRGRIDIHELNFGTMEGKVVSKLTITDNKKGTFYLTSSSGLDNLNIRELFNGFNNFGQDALCAEHLGGYLSGRVSFNAVFDSTMKISKENIFTNADFTIRAGELIDFEPMEKLSKFVELEELQHIRFSELKNSILIQNNQLTIPEMDIKSNAFNITASGIHNFSGDFDYKLKILLSELLTSKAQEKSNEYYVMEDNRRASLYLSIYGTAKDYKIKYDKEEALSAIKEDIKREKSNLKTILNEEFGWFKKDSARNEIKSSDQPEFILDWEEDSVKTTNKKKKGLFRKTPAKSKKEKEIFELEWDEEDDG